MNKSLAELSVKLSNRLKELVQTLNIRAKEFAVKSFQDERVSDESLTDMRYKFKVETFFCLVNTFFQQVSNRFADFRQHVSKLFVLDL